MRVRATSLAVLAVLLLGSLLVEGAGTVERPGADPLMQRALSRGSVRVLVQLGVPFVPEGRMASRAHVTGQRHGIVAAQGTVRSGLRGLGHRVAREFDGRLPLMAIEASPDALRMLRSMRGTVLAIREDRPRRPSLGQTTSTLGASTVWNAGFDGTNQIVAILDTGVRTNHPFFAAGGGKILAEACFSSTFAPDAASSVCPGGATESHGPGSALPCAAEGCDHGTHVAGIAAGDGRGISGAPPGGVARGAKIVAVQIFSSVDDEFLCGGATFTPCPLSYPSDQVAALLWLDTQRLAFGDQRIAAANLSLGGDFAVSPCPDDDLAPAIAQLRAPNAEDATDPGVATVIAAGNDGYTDAISIPACNPGAIAVGATPRTGSVVSSFSNVADPLIFPNLVLAPGGEFGSPIISSLPPSGFGGSVGTSMATPHVSGALAVLRQIRPTDSVDALLGTLQSTGRLVRDGRAPCIGCVYGNVTLPRIDVLAAAGQLAPPNLVVQTLTAPTSAVIGVNLTVSTSVRNAGVGAAASSNLNLYLSTDNTITTADTLLGSLAFGPLNGGITAPVATTSLTLPPGITPGAYFIGAIADADGQRTETSEADNTRAVAITLVQPDLLVTALSAPATGQTGRPLVIAHTVRNRGTSAASGFRVSFYMALGDSTPGAGTLVGFRDVASLAANGNSSASTTITIPVGFSGGTYFLSARVDSASAVLESDELNNELAAGGTVEVTLYRPDLVVTALSSPTAAQTSRPLAITSKVRNQGPAPAGAFRLNFYLAQGDSTPGAGTLIGFRSLASLPALTTSSATTTVIIPANLSAGTYFLSAVADPLANVELPGANNGLTAPSPVEVTLYRPDLTITALSSPLSGQTGRPLKISHTVRNQGPAPAGPFRVNFYMALDDGSPAAAEPGAGTLVGFRALTSLAGLASSSATTTITIPANFSAGSYFVSSVADPLANVELPGGSNGLTAAARVAITLYRPDLVLTRLTSPLVGQTSRPLAISHTVRNQGPAPAGGFRINFYMTPVGGGAEAATLVGVRAVASLAAFTNSSAVTTVKLPAGLEAGSYVLSAGIDPLVNVELPGANNELTAPDAVTVSLYRPDLTMTALTAPSLGKIGRTITVTSTVRNAGNAPAGAFKVRFYVAPVNGPPGSWTTIGARAVSSLAVNASATASTGLTLPATSGLGDGPHSLLAVADGDAQQVELDENNNQLTAATPIELTVLKPDLTVSAATVTPTLASPGFTLKVGNSVRNVGDVPTAGPVLVRFYLSPTPTLDGGAELIGSRTIVPPLAVGATSGATTALVVPPTTTVGLHHVVVVANADGAVVEYPGSNNARATTAVNVQLPDLRVMSIAPPPAAIRGKLVSPPTAAVVIKNIGHGPSLPFQVQVFANRDDGSPAAQTPGLGDLIFGRPVSVSLAPNGTATVSGPVVVPETVVSVVRNAGNYFLSAVADAAAANVEPDSTNNQFTEPVKKVAVLPDMRKLTTASVDLSLGDACGVTLLGLAGPFTMTSQTVANPSTFSGTVTLADTLGSGFSQVYTVSGTVQAVDVEGTAGKILSSFTYQARVDNAFASSGRGSITGAAPGLDFTGGAISGQDTAGSCTFGGSIDVTR
jgi:subtilase family serine protease